MELEDFTTFISIDLELTSEKKELINESSNKCNKISSFLYYFGFDGEFYEYSKIKKENKYFFITK